MDDLDVPRDELARWVCIAEHESSYRTWVVGPANSDGSRDHGIFQINDRYWCLPSDGGRSSNGCQVNCDALRTDHINRAVRCAQKVKREQGWDAWSVYRPHCSGRLPSLQTVLEAARILVLDMPPSNRSCFEQTHKWYQDAISIR